MVTLNVYIANAHHTTLRQSSSFLEYHVLSGNFECVGYMPGRLYDLNDCKYGNEDKLRETIDKFHKAGLRCIADIVVNHRCGDAQDERGEWVIFEGGTPDDALDWGPWAVVGNDYPYGNGTGEDQGLFIFFLNFFFCLSVAI